MTDLKVGDRAPAIIGVAQGGRFFSQDAQAGRPVLLIPLGGREPEEAADLFRIWRPMGGMLETAGADLIFLAPQDARLAAAFERDPQAQDRIVYVAQAAGLETFTLDGAAAAVMLDRSGRIVSLTRLIDTPEAVEELRQVASRLRPAPPRLCATSAPVLIIPNVASLDLCAALIEHFERSPHQAGLMASLTDGAPVAKLDEAKKRRRDMELTAETPLFAEVVQILAERCAPEIKRAFQADITYADRILIARYDDTGGYFKRHRDDATPQTAFREFAVSLNLNTHDYEGGELLFPEYDDNRYSPPAGGAIMFSASLLHEAAPVTRGRRYVLLSFLCTGNAQVRATEAA